MENTSAEYSAGPKNHRFNPYTSNGGSTVGLSGIDYVILAGDTRSTNGYSINSRFETKVWRVSDENEQPILLSAVGFTADGKNVHEKLRTFAIMYKFKHGKPISLRACAHRLSTLLYAKRFFPYQVQTMLGGLNEDGVGTLYTYDPVGTYEQNVCRAAGGAGPLMEPFLDTVFLNKNQYLPKLGSEFRSEQQTEDSVKPLPKLHAVQVVKDAFTVAAERHIEVGDSLQILVVTAAGVEEIISPLRRD